MCIFRRTNGLFVQTLSAEHRESSLCFQRLRVAPFFVCAWGEWVMAGDEQKTYSFLLVTFSWRGGSIAFYMIHTCVLRPSLKSCQGCWNVTRVTGSLAPKQAKKKIDELRACLERRKVLTWSHCQLAPRLHSVNTLRRKMVHFLPPQNISFIFMLGKKKPMWFISPFKTH